MGYIPMEHAAAGLKVANPHPIKRPGFQDYNKVMTIIPTVFF